MASREARSRSRKRRSSVGLAVAGLLLGGAAGVARRAGLGRRLGFGGGPSDRPSPSPSLPIPLAPPSGSGGSDGSPGTSGSPSAHDPGPANYDVDGPPANTATHVPVPPAAMPSAIDEEAEAAAAAAEAAAIGGEVSSYASSNLGDTADDVESPLIEAGEGTSEGFEQALAEQVDAASPSDRPSPYEQQIDEAIDQQENPFSGESSELFDAVDEAPVDLDQPGDDMGASSTGASSDAGEDERDPGDWSERGERP